MSGATSRQLAVFQSRSVSPSPVYPAGRVGTSADPNIPGEGVELGYAASSAIDRHQPETQWRQRERRRGRHGGRDAVKSAVRAAV